MNYVRLTIYISDNNVERLYLDNTKRATFNYLNQTYYFDILNIRHNSAYLVVSKKL